MRSRNVKQEIQLGWHYGRPYLPLLLDPIKNYPEQVQYWLEGCQWIEVLRWPVAQWLPRVLRALANAGVKSTQNAVAFANPIAQPTQSSRGHEGLLALARFTDQIWPVPAERAHRDFTRPALRDLGVPQDGVQHFHRLGSHICVAIESECARHLLLLDEGPTGKIYCLCPSQFAKETRLTPGRTYLPQRGSPYDAFVISGQCGREHLLAILSDKPLGLDWMGHDRSCPARVVSKPDVDELLARLGELPPQEWTALATFFDVIA